MFKATTIDFRTSGALNPLVLDYIEKNETTRSYYEHYPDTEGFAALIGKQPFEAIDRDALCAIVKNQAQQVQNTSGPSLKNIDTLLNKNTYTVTTGHQLCLFTGPLYFVYKILSVINVAKQLNHQFSTHHFVPVYWMATEDHDFEEVNHFTAFGKTVRWESQQAGPVGNFDTGELAALQLQLTELFGTGARADELMALFHQSYLLHPNLGVATRHLVNTLFGTHGLVVVDGNDRAFKAQFTTLFKKDILENGICGPVEKTIGRLKAAGYHPQVNPRPINCFYSVPGQRDRIEKKGDGYVLVNSGRTLTGFEMEQLIDQQPEKISPNVVLRPVFQQTILPNIAYVGGPGELAYWLEFLDLFKGLGVQFPILMPRTFVTLVDKGTASKVAKLKLSVADFYKPEDEIIKHFQTQNHQVLVLDEEKAELSAVYEQLLAKVTTIDKTLAGNVGAELQKTINGLDALAGKANRALKQRSETEIGQIRTTRQKLAPNGVPQERVENFSSFYLKWGMDFLKQVDEAMDPFLFRQLILEED